ncbi:MAG TPA: M56 family metallopeptidase [Blastocatellia bacterium]|nr:M56 family metallopeptidase [Blastocatellia bacterium]
MNAIADLLDKPIFQALGWTLIHFIWQGALIGILYFSVSLMLRRRSANVRYTTACMAMLLMLIAPAATLVIIRASADLPATEAANEWGAAIQLERVTLKQFQPPSVESVDNKEIEPVRASTSDAIVKRIQDVLPRFIPWFLALWFAGVLFLSLRFARGLVVVHRLKRVETGPSIRIWESRLSSLCQRLKVSRPVRLCESVLVEVPTVVGWLRPVILLPASALTGLSAEQLEALLAHELAHIRRFDYLVNLLQTSIETLFFYHPAVWWVSAQIRQEREHCCDDLAVAACGNVLTYARALTALEDLRGSGPQLAVAASGGSLLMRIQRLLRGRSPAFHRFEGGMAGFIALAAVFILLLGAQAAFLSRVNAAVKQVLELSEHNDTADSSLRPTADIPQSIVNRTKADKPVISGPEISPSLEASKPASEESSPAADETPAQTSPSLEGQDFRSQLLAAGLTNANGEQMDTFRIHGVTAQFVRDMVGILSTKIDADAAIALRIHGISPARANEFKALGLDRLDAGQLIAFGVHGVTPQFISEMRALGCGPTDADGFVAFRIHGVTPRFIQGLKDVGYPNLSGDQLIAFAIHGVTPVFIQTMKIFVPGRLSEDDLLGFRIHGVTADMIKELEIMGFTKLTASQLIGLRIHGVTPKYIRSIQDAGLDRATVNEITELRMFGITPDFIQMVKSRGFTDVTPQQLVELRRLKILPSAKQN